MKHGQTQIRFFTLFRFPPPNSLLGNTRMYTLLLYITLSATCFDSQPQSGTRGLYMIHEWTFSWQNATHISFHVQIWWY